MFPKETPNSFMLGSDSITVAAPTSTADALRRGSHLRVPQTKNDWAEVSQKASLKALQKRAAKQASPCTYPKPKSLTPKPKLCIVDPKGPKS